MGLFDALGSFGQFLETKLDEFLRAHPELELQILADQVDQQYAEALNLLKNSQAEEERYKKQILELAEEIKTWHGRVEKAKQAKRPDLATQAQAVEDRLLQQGNTLWAAMKAAAQRQVDTRQLLQQIEGKREEIKRRQQELWRQQAQSTPEPWGSPRGDQQWQELERQFRELELQLELDELRRKR
ncbi:MAG: TIGR04376 family protein [Thermostichales cyanobacterium SZTDM-1c_bins_54]